MSENEILNKGSSLYPYRLLPRPLLSSTGLGWKGLLVERHHVPACELPDLPIAHHIVELVLSSTCPLVNAQIGGVI
jgi:hypothetical protein